MHAGTNSQIPKAIIDLIQTALCEFCSRGQTPRLARNPGLCTRTWRSPAGGPPTQCCKKNFFDTSTMAPEGRGGIDRTLAIAIVGPMHAAAMSPQRGRNLRWVDPQRMSVVSSFRKTERNGCPLHTMACAADQVCQSHCSMQHGLLTNPQSLGSASTATVRQRCDAPGS